MLTRLFHSSIWHCDFCHSMHRQVAYLTLIYAAKYILLCTTKILQWVISERKQSFALCALLWIVTNTDRVIRTVAPAKPQGFIYKYTFI